MKTKTVKKTKSDTSISGNLLEGISCLINGDYTIDQLMIAVKCVPLVFATVTVRRILHFQNEPNKSIHCLRFD